jgi:uncharacterized protein (DUF885 family)
VATQARGDVAALVSLHEEFTKASRPVAAAGLPDYSPAAMAARQKALAGFRARLDAIDPSSWPVPDKVDYLLVKAQMNALDFDHRVLRPWARDPNTYVDLVRRTAHADVPVPAADLAAFRERLQAVPRVLDQARGNLTEMPGELANMAIRQLEKSDGVNQGEPRRAVPPEGVIGWYQDFVERVSKQQPDLAADAKAALTAVQGYRDWLRKQVPSLEPSAGVGLDHYGWFVRNVRLMPFTVDDVRLIGLRELERGRTLLKIEQHRNRALPQIEPAKTAEEHERRTREAERLIREFIVREKILTLPPDLPAEFETDAFWIVRPGGKRHFWEEITYRDPLNNHIHASIPGHQFDGILQRKQQRPIRRGYRDGARGEGWGFYIEEMFLQAGLLDDRPRSKELFYIAQLKRAARIPAELKMQTGEFTLQQAIEYLIAQVPLMEEDLARYDLALYLRRPAFGMNYTVGKAQMERLLSDRAHQLGDKFDLGAFHDEFLSKGSIPMSLIRYEMTGLDDEVREFFKKGS